MANPYLNDPDFVSMRGGSASPDMYGGDDTGNVLQQLATGIKDDVIFGIKSIPYLPAALMPSNGTMGFLDDTIDPEELRHRKRAVADAAMLLAGAGMGALAAKVAAPGGAAILRTILGGQGRAAAMGGATENVIFGQINKMPGEEVNPLVDAAVGAGFGFGIQRGLGKLFHGKPTAPATELAKEASTAIVPYRGVLRTAEEELAGSADTWFVGPDGGGAMRGRDIFSASRAQVVPEPRGTGSVAEVLPDAMPEPELTNPLEIVMRRVLQAREESLAQGDVGWVDDAVRRAARVQFEGPKRAIDLLEGDFVLPAHKTMVRGLHAEAGQHNFPSRNARLQFASEVLGRPVTTFSDLNQLEMLNVTNELRRQRGVAPIVPTRTPATAAIMSVRGGHAVLHFMDTQHRDLFNLTDRLAREVVDEAEMDALAKHVGVTKEGLPIVAQMYKDFVATAARANRGGRLAIPTWDEFMTKLPDLAVRSREEVLASLTNRTDPVASGAVGRSGRRATRSVPAPDQPKMTREQALEKARAAKAANAAARRAAAGGANPTPPPSAPGAPAAPAAPAAPGKGPARTAPGPGSGPAPAGTVGFVQGSGRKTATGNKANKRSPVFKVDRKQQPGTWGKSTLATPAGHGQAHAVEYRVGGTAFKFHVARNTEHPTNVRVLMFNGYNGTGDTRVVAKAKYKEIRELVNTGKIDQAKARKMMAANKVTSFYERQTKEFRGALRHMIAEMYNTQGVRVITIDPKSTAYPLFKELEASGFMAEAGTKGMFGLKQNAGLPPGVRKREVKAAPANLRPKHLDEQVGNTLARLSKMSDEDYDKFVRRFLRSKGIHPRYTDLAADNPEALIRDAKWAYDNGKMDKATFEKLEAKLYKDLNDYNKAKAAEVGTQPNFDELGGDSTPLTPEEEAALAAQDEFFGDMPDDGDMTGGAPVVAPKPPTKPSGGAGTAKKPGAMEYVNANGQKIVRPNSTIMFNGVKAKALGVSVDQAVDGTKQAVVLVEANGSTAPVPLHEILDQNPGLLQRPGGAELRAASQAISDARPANSPAAVERPTPPKAAPVAEAQPNFDDLGGADIQDVGMKPGDFEQNAADAAVMGDGLGALNNFPEIAPDPTPPAPAPSPPVRRLGLGEVWETKWEGERREARIAGSADDPVVVGNAGDELEAAASEVARLQQIARNELARYNSLDDIGKTQMYDTLKAAQRDLQVAQKKQVELEKRLGTTGRGGEAPAPEVQPSVASSVERKKGEKAETQQGKFRRRVEEAGLTVEVEKVRKMLFARRFDPEVLSPEQVQQVKDIQRKLLSQAGESHEGFDKVVAYWDAKSGAKSAGQVVDNREFDRVVALLRENGSSEEYINQIIDAHRRVTARGTS